MAGHVKILLAATFREIAGQREILEEIGSGSTLGDILSSLARRYGKVFDGIIDSKTGQVGFETWVMVNGKSVRSTDVKLKDTDVVIIAVPVGGG